MVCVRGQQSAMGYLCGAFELQLTSGRAVAFLGENSATFGDPFEYKLPSAAHPHTPNHTPNTSPGALRDLRFSGGRCLGIQLEPIRIQFEPERPQKSGRALSEPSAPREQRLGSTLAPPRVLELLLHRGLHRGGGGSGRHLVNFRRYPSPHCCLLGLRRRLVSPCGCLVNHTAHP